MTDELDEIMTKFRGSQIEPSSLEDWDNAKQAIQAYADKQTSTMLAVQRQLESAERAEVIERECNRARINELIVYDQSIRSGKNWIQYIEDRIKELQSNTDKDNV